MPAQTAGNQLTRIDNPAAVTGMVRHFGYLDVTRVQKDGSQEFDARFATFDTPTPASIVLENFAVPPPDTCETSSRTSPIQIRDELDFPGHPYKFVSAGKTVPVLHDGGSYINMSREDDEGGIRYGSAMSGAAVTMGGHRLLDLFVRTADLELSIPGSTDFPAVAAIPVPNVSNLSGFNLDEDDRVSADTRFTWKAGNTPEARIQISAGGGGRAVFCAAQDDGQFEFPPAIRNWIGTDTIPNPEAYRDATVFYQIGDLIFIVSQSTDL